MYLHNTKDITNGSFTIGDTQYPANWLQFSTAEEREAIGISWVDDPVPVPPTLASLQAFVWEQIKNERERRRTGGVLVAGKWFHNDDSSRIQHLGLTMMGAGIPAGLQWKTMDGSFVIMTQTLAGQIFMAVAAADQANFGRAELHRMTMEALPDPTGYDFSAGWLATYGE